MIDLVCGDPWSVEKNRPATYTRFILPFHYMPKNIKREKPNLICNRHRFESIKLDQIDSERKSYFTTDTANVLYKKAVWAEVPRNEWESHAGPFTLIVQNEKKVKIKISPPAIMLFEWDDFSAGESRQNSDILQNGFLIVELYFDDVQQQGNIQEQEPVTFENLLRVNELFRYFAKPFDAHEKDYEKFLGSFLEEFNKSKKEPPGTEQRDIYLHHWLSLLRYPLLHNGKLYEIIPEEWLKDDSIKACTENVECKNEKCLIYADNRTFVWTCAIVKNGANLLQNRFPKKEGLAEPWNFGHWVKLLNVDQSEEDQAPRSIDASITNFEKQWAKKRTYQRWAEYGTFYGYSYHSGATLGPHKQERIPLWRHFGGMYFDQIILLFYLRIVLFSFSKKLTDIHQSRSGDEENKVLREKFKSLRSDFARFTNLYQFPLISNQQQGMEMYDIARTSLTIDQLFDEIRYEITSTHELLEMEASARFNERDERIATRANIIAEWGIPLAVAALVVSTIGQPKDLFDSLKGCWFHCPPDYSFLGQLLVVIISWCIAHYIVKKRLSK